jgi:hypothetical protein
MAPCSSAFFNAQLDQLRFQRIFFFHLQNNDIRPRFNGTLIHHFLLLPLAIGFLAGCMFHCTVKTLLVSSLRPLD